MYNYDLVIKSKNSILDGLYTYASDKKLERGVRVIVPFGQGNVKNLALVVGENRDEISFKTKKIFKVIDEKPIIAEDLIDTAIFMVKDSISDYSSAFSAVFPPGSIDKINEYFFSKDESDDRLIKFLREARTYEDIKKEFKSSYSNSYLNDLVDKGLIFSFLDYESKSSVKMEYTYSLTNTNYNKLLRKNASKMLAILDYIKDNGPTEKTELENKLGSVNSSIKTLIKKDLIKEKKTRIFRRVLNEKVDDYIPHVLNEEQKKVYDTILNSDRDFFLLKGVTGSGKTEVYLQLVKKYLDLGKEAIILVPEISLTPQTIARFQGRFGNNIAVIHSKLSISERADQWKLIKNRQVKIVVGVRSAIFAPFENLGIIIIDEEHEDSYRSDKNPKYNTIDIAFFRAKRQKCKVLLGTATPSIKTMYDSINNRIELLTMDNRVSNFSLPEVIVMDMREELKDNNFTMFSNRLREEIELTLKKQKQVILFLNKRGHSSFVFCRSCGYVHKCDACDVSMTYHKNKNRLICHYCGRTSPKPTICKNCGSKWIKEFGAGTEMLEDEAKKLFPHAIVFRMDADTIKNRKDYEKVYKMMVDKKIDILLGTQMLAKGLDFPNVELVGIMSADLSLNIPNFRAGEKTYSLITQVSGRAGRGSSNGKVIIQTYNPDNYAIKSASENDYISFFKREISKRKSFNYPPFVNILNINISCLDRQYAISYSKDLIMRILTYIRSSALKLLEATGPTPSIIERINNRYRFDILLKSNNADDLINIGEYIRSLKKDSKIYLNFKLERE